MSTWNNLSMREKAAYMLAAVRNGYRDLDSIRGAYNKFAEGGDEPIFSFSAPTVSRTTSEAPVLAAKPDAVKIENKPFVAPVTNINLTKNNDVNDTFSNIVAYTEGSKIKDRLRTMYGTQQAADAKLAHMHRMNNGFMNNPSRMLVNSTKSSMAGNNQVFINPSGQWSNSLNPTNAVTAHEYAGHIMYPDMQAEMSKFSPEYLQRLNAFADKEKGLQVSLNINKGISAGTDREFLEHDRDIEEYIPFIKETQEDMRKQGVWDYTKGNPLDPDTYRKYLEANPKARTQYWKDNDATWLLNNTASIDLPKADDYTNLAAYGGGLNSPFSHSAIPAVRYAEGGNLFLEGGPEGFWDKLDTYAEKAELPLAGVNAASWLATMVAPNPVTPVAAYGASLLGAGVDAYQAARAAIKGDYKTAAQNAGEFGLGLIGATGAKAASKAAKAASKAAKATKAGKQVSTALSKAPSVPVPTNNAFGKYLKWADKGSNAIMYPQRYSIMSQIGNDYYTAGKEGVKLYKQGKL